MVYRTQPRSAICAVGIVQGSCSSDCPKSQVIALSFLFRSRSLLEEED
ncbi:MAG: hypothetical protein HXY43_07215 [Fischerella sp.]|nr:hypothetical protein [Fischerella sp.]NWF59087.1 hypothetical protein [Fischerella sp.]